MTRLNPGRLAAVRALISVDGGGHVELVRGEHGALARHLTLGVLRRRGTLDATIEKVAKRKMAKLDPAVRACLRTGAFEILFSRTPARAAVDQAVAACRTVGLGRATGFVNAVLRRTADVPPPTDPWLDLPLWLRERWHPQAEAWVVRAQEPARIAVCGRPGQTPGEGWEAATAGGAPVADCWWLQDGARLDDVLGRGESSWWVMDPAAVAVADRACIGRSILDACAAPGGKTLRLASRGLEVTAVDSSSDRMARLQENIQRVGLSAHLVQHDWTTGQADLGRFDTVLVDAPCTALGTIRRHPEVRWSRQPTDPAAMAIRQSMILEAASAHVAEDGNLMYSVCSPLVEEGRAVVDRLSGWKVSGTWSNWPPSGDEDAHQLFELQRQR